MESLSLIIFDSLLHQGVSRMFFLVDKKDVASKRWLSFKRSEFPISIITVDSSSSILETLSHVDINSSESILINSGDTLFTGRLSFDKDLLVVSKRDVFSLRDGAILLRIKNLLINLPLIKALLF